MPGNIIPLREGEDIQQIDTRVDFWPAQVHSDELKESLYFSSGLTPIAWGMSPNAQTSGRALSAEWRAVELPLASRLGAPLGISLLGPAGSDRSLVALAERIAAG